MSALTYDERERIAYINGDAPLAELLDCAACIEDGWLSPEEAEALRSEVNTSDTLMREAEDKLADARDRIADLQALLRDGMALAPLDSEEWADWAARALEATP
jgi:hypothetical protein